MATAKPTRCSNCGSAELRSVPWHRRLAYWFQHGRGGAVVQCEACGEPDNARTFVMLGHESPRSRAGRLIRTITGVCRATLDNRTRQPNPRFYATLGGAALPPALLVGALLPRHRWRAVVGFPAIAMLGGLAWSVSSAINPQTRRAITWQLDPQAAMRRDLDAEVARIRGAARSLLLLQPDGWDGELAFGGCAYSWAPGGPERVTQISVVGDHGPHERAGPPTDPRRVEVETSIERFLPTEDELLEQLAGQERGARQDDAQGPSGHEPAELERWVVALEAECRARGAELAGGWRDGTVTVDGEAVLIRLIEGDGVALALLELEEQQVRIEAVGVPVDGMALTRVTDVEPLLATMRERRTAWLATD